MSPADGFSPESKDNGNTDPKINASNETEDAAINVSVEPVAAPKPKMKQPPTRPGFQLVKIRMPDGTVKRAWRPILDNAAASNGTTSNTAEPEPKPQSKQTEEVQPTTSVEDRPPAYTVAVATKPTTSSPPADVMTAPTVNQAGHVDNNQDITKRQSAETGTRVAASLSKAGATTTITAANSGTSKDHLEISFAPREPVKLKQSAPQSQAVETASNTVVNTNSAAPLVSEGRHARAAAPPSTFRRILERTGVATAAQTLAQDWNIDITDMPHAGDEIISDDEWPSDSSDIEDENGYTGRKGREQDRSISRENGHGDEHNDKNNGIYQHASASTEKHSLTKKPGNTTSVTEREMSGSGAMKTIKPPTKEANPLHRPSRFSQIFVWSTMMGLPLLYIALGIETITLRHTVAGSPRGNMTQQAIKVAVTAWPIIYAAIVAQSLKAFATYRVERGIRLMALEQLISSNSVASAIKQPFLLRRFDLVAIALLCLWGLQPIASQGLQNMLYTSPYLDPPSNQDVTYMDLTQFNPERSEGPRNRAIDSMFAAALLPKGKIAKEGVDPYMYPLIPALHYTQAWKLNQTTGDGWYDTSDATATGYSASLYGIYSDNPVGKTNGTSKYSMTTSYWRFDCDAPVNRTWDEIHAMALPNLHDSKTGTFFMEMNPPWDESVKDGRTSATGNLTLLSMLPQVYYLNEDGESVKTTFNSTVAYAFCRMSQLLVQAELHCVPEKCVVQQMKPLENPGLPGMSSLIQHYFVSAASGVALEGDATMVELYLNDPQNVLKPEYQFHPDLTSITRLDFEQRLSILFNTFWQLGFSAEDQTSVYEVPASPSLLARSTAAYIGPPYDIYELNIPWLVTLFVSSAVLLGSGIASAWWEHHTIGPDVLGFASSIVRQSKYIKGPKGSTAESGSQRANRMKDHEVMMQDVKPDAAIGKIALGTKSDTSVPLKPTKLYR